MVYRSLEIYNTMSEHERIQSTFELRIKCNLLTLYQGIFDSELCMHPQIYLNTPSNYPLAILRSKVFYILVLTIFNEDA